MYEHENRSIILASDTYFGHFDPGVSKFCAKPDFSFYFSLCMVVIHISTIICRVQVKLELWKRVFPHKHTHITTLTYSHSILPRLFTSLWLLSIIQLDRLFCWRSLLPHARTNMLSFASYTKCLRISLFSKWFCSCFFVLPFFLFANHIFVNLIPFCVTKSACLTFSLRSFVFSSHFSTWAIVINFCELSGWYKYHAVAFSNTSHQSFN